MGAMKNLYTALEEMAEMLGDDRVAGDVGPALNCGEAEVLASVLRAARFTDHAEAWIAGHKSGDEPGEHEESLKPIWTGPVGVGGGMRIALTTTQVVRIVAGEYPLSVRPRRAAFHEYIDREGLTYTIRRGLDPDAVTLPALEEADPDAAEHLHWLVEDFGNDLLDRE